MVTAAQAYWINRKRRQKRNAASEGVGEAVPRIALALEAIDEDASVGDLWGTLSTSNTPDDWGDDAYTITADADEVAQLDGSDDTLLEVGAALDYETATSHQITITNTPTGPYDPISRTFTLPVGNVLEVTLGALTIDDDEAVPGEAWSATITGKSSGSTIIAASSDGTVLSVVGTTVSGTFAAEGTPNVTLTETHADASNSPNDSVIAVTVSSAPDLPLGLVAEGDSLTAGRFARTFGDYPRQLGRYAGLPVQNFATTGHTINTMISDYASSVGPAYNALTADTLPFMAGTNDLFGGDSAATAISELQTYSNLGLATGYRVPIGTIPPRGDDAPTQAKIDVVNAAIRVNYLAWGCTWLIDFAAWPTLTDPTNLTYFNADKVHLTDAGYYEMMLCAAAAMSLTAQPAHNSVNGAPIFRPYPLMWNDSSGGGDDIAAYSTDMLQETFNANSYAVLEQPIVGKKAFAFQFVSGVTNFAMIGLVPGDDPKTGGDGPGVSSSTGIGLYNNGSIFSAGGSVGSGLSFGDGDTIVCLVDETTKQVWFTDDGVTFIAPGFTGVTAAEVAAGTNSTPQSWGTGTLYAATGNFSGGGTTTKSVPVGIALPGGYSQL